MFRDEAPYLKEWVEYHRMLGVEHFYLYNNESADNYLEVLEPYVKANIVEILDWPDVFDIAFMRQRAAFNHCLQRVKGKTSWLAIIDIDEFIVPVQTDDLKSFLSKYDSKKYVGAIQMNWQLYGTSFLPSIPEGKLLIESLILKAPWDYTTEDLPCNTRFKSIVRPQAIEEYKVHGGTFKNSYYAVPKGGGERDQPIQIDEIRLNHYFTRAEDFFYGVKIGRRLQNRPDSYLAVMMQKLIDLNQVEDTIMNRFVPALKERMKESSL